MRPLVQSIFLLLIFHWFMPLVNPILAQPVFLEEDFDTWFSSCAPNWNCQNLGNCTSSTCRWSRQDQLPQNSLPASTDCGGSGFYARCYTQALNPGEQPVLISPFLDLSTYTDSPSLGIYFCMVNASQTSFDTDTLWIDVSDDAGLSWTNIWSSDTVNQNWERKTVAIPTNSYTGNFRFRFRASGNAASGDMGVDNVEVRPQLPECQALPSSIQADRNTVICKSTNNAIVNFSTDYSGYGSFSFILTDSLDRILSEIQGSQFDAALLPEGLYRVYGISYTGTLEYLPLQPIFSVQASQCNIFAANSLELHVYQPKAEIQLLSDYNGFAVSRKGGRDGRAIVNPSNGFAPYSITWETPIPVIGTHANTLPAGSWNIKIKDSRGCVSNQTITLNEPDSLKLSLTAENTPNCASDSIGIISSSVEGGVMPYTYEWSNGASSQDLANVPGDIYSLRLRDANGVEVVKEISLLFRPPLESQIEISRPSCSKDPEAMVLVSVQGGQSPYQYQWSDGVRTASRDELGEGSYTLQISDELGCKLIKTILIEPPLDTLRVDAMLNQGICGEDSLGDILLKISGGQSPYDILWSTGDISNNLYDLEPGTYEVMVSDSLDCLTEASFVLNPPKSLDIALEVVADNGEDKGSIDVDISGGTSPYTLIWENGTNSKKQEMLSSGNYPLRVEDANGCTVDTLIQVPFDPSLPAVCDELEIGFSPNGDGVNDFFELPCLESFDNHVLEVYNRWGQLLYTQQNYQQNWDGTVEGNSLPDGSYFWIATLTIGNRTVQLNGTLVIVR
ncbi:MAG: gliding motility-associated C-terminal domain-containing protein [Bacteroidia bacterium]|nr:gliding motility-associated C-terminal domain-containing protein [Bacteroidia bacterium]